MTVVVEPELGALFAGDYRLERRLKAGGMGAVFVAEQVSTGLRRAIKLMHVTLRDDERQRQRFIQEAKLAARIRSDHVVQVVGAGVDAATGIPWLAMELLLGEDLGTRLKRAGALPPDEVRDILEQLCDALSAAHAADVVHRDLKLENVFLEAREGAPPRVKVLDFGIAKMIADAAAQATAAIGTPHWMAPEQTASGEAISARADLWPVGLLGFALLTGKLFWKAAHERPASAVRILREVAVEPLCAASERAALYGLGDRLPPGFDGWFARCVARDVDARFADAAACREGLAAALDATGEPTLYQPPSLADVAPPPARAGWPLVTAGVVAGVALVAGVAAMVRAPAPPAAAPPQEVASAAPSAAPSHAPPAASAEPRWRVAVGASPQRGPPAALVTIVEFADFQCPLSKSTLPAVQRVLAELGDDVRLVWKEDPLAIHPRAEAATMVARLALVERGHAGFWAAHDRLFALQPDLDDRSLELAAGELSLDLGAVRQAWKSQRFLEDINADVDEADGLLVGATPTLFVNGRRLEGPQRYEPLRAVVDEELARARALVASGVAPADVYAELQKGAAAPREPERRALPAPTSNPPFEGGGAEDQITLNVFCDYQDPLCRRIAPVTEQLLARYGTRVLMAWRDAPRPQHPQARLAAAAAREAFAQLGSKGFVAMRQRLFENQARPGGLELAALLGYAREVGLDAGAFRRALEAGVHDEAIDADVRAAAAARLDTLPALLVETYYLAGMTSFRTLTKLCDRALAERRAPR